MTFLLAVSGIKDVSKTSFLGSVFYAGTARTNAAFEALFKIVFKRKAF